MQLRQRGDLSGMDLVVRSGVAKNQREQRVPIDATLAVILRHLEAGRKE
jgi:hypothetical protein